jgi:hypothetical protein
VETVPGIAMVTWNTNLPANRRVVYGNASNPTLTTDANYGYPSSTDLVSTPLLTAHGMVVAIDQSQTYYFRPVSSDGKTTVTGTELILLPTTTTTTTTSGGTTGSCYYLHDYLRQDLNNNPVEVKKLQIFLNAFEGDTLQVTGIYDDATVAAVNAFQVKYLGDVLTPWGYDGTTGTGYTYILTKKKVNEIYCQMAFPVNAQQQAEIDATKIFFDTLRSEGIDVNTANTTNPIIPASETTPLLNNVVGESTSTGNSNYSTLAGISSTTQGFASIMTANVISSGRTLGNLALAFFTWPFGNMLRNDSVNWCVSGFSGGWFSWLLLLIIIIILALWYRQYHNNKKIEKANKEIDLQ